MTTPVLSIRNLTKHHLGGSGRFDALKGVSLDIADGESVAIVVKSGTAWMPRNSRARE